MWIVSLSRNALTVNAISFAGNRTRRNGVCTDVRPLRPLFFLSAALFHIALRLRAAPGCIRAGGEGKMSQQILITGGAGFIASHLADELLRSGYRVRALDNLDPQVHGATAARPTYLADDVELIVGDVRNPDDLHRALRGVDAVYHFAAAVGVGQS